MTATNSLKIFVFVGSIWALVMGFIGPFFIVHIEKLSGGMEKLGIAFSIMILVQSATTYFAGRFSDRLGRKPFMILTGFVNAITIFLYSIVKSSSQLYLLQALLGITNGVAATVNSSFLGDLTVKEKRGRVIGSVNATIGLASAAGVTLSGFFVKYYGLKNLFYFASLCVGLSTFLLFFVKED